MRAVMTPRERADFQRGFDSMIEQVATKRRPGRPRKAVAQPEGVDASPELEAAPAKPPRPTAPVLAREVVDFLLDRYDWEPGDWRAVLTTMTLVTRLGSYWSQRTRKA